MSRRRSTHIVWICSIFLAAGLACLTGASISVRHEWRFHREAVPVEAVVVGSWRWGVDYVFTPPHSAPVHGEGTSQKLPTGSHITAWYLPRDPSKNRLTAQFRNIEVLCIAFLVGSLLTFMGGGALLFAVRDFVRAR